MASSNFLDQIKDLTQNLMGSTKEATQWYKDKITDLRKGKDPEYDRDQNLLFKKTSMPEIGSMFLFAYDPKTKATLPFYDMYPLVIPIEFDNNGFLGLNLHYLPPNARVTFLNSLTTVSNNDKYDKTTKLNLSYKILKNYSRFGGYEVCVKRYLYGHVRSSFHSINPADWKKVVMLPLQRWEINPNKKYAGSPPY